MGQMTSIETAPFSSVSIDDKGRLSIVRGTLGRGLFLHLDLTDAEKEAIVKLLKEG